SQLFAYLDAVQVLFGESDVMKCPPEITQLAVNMSQQLQPAVKRQSKKESVKRRRTADKHDRDCLIALLSLKQGIPVRTLSELLDLPLNTVQNAITEWTPRLALVGRALSTLPHSEKVARWLMPKELIGKCVYDC
ncbi:MAG TPA: hypothetical protein VEF04_01205, partial [Blastocatellia bacterium]|nr:hypothetical protein [Blastocatellia bacterium]